MTMDNAPIVPAAVAVGETVNSADPAVTLGPAKAVVAAIGGALVGGLTSLSTALAGDGIVSAAEWVAVALAVVLGTGLVGGATYLTRTTVTGNG